MFSNKDSDKDKNNKSNKNNDNNNNNNSSRILYIINYKDNNYNKDANDLTYK